MDTSSPNPENISGARGSQPRVPLSDDTKFLAQHTTQETMNMSNEISYQIRDSREDIMAAIRNASVSMTARLMSRSPKSKTASLQLPEEQASRMDASSLQELNEKSQSLSLTGRAAGVQMEEVLAHYAKLAEEAIATAIASEEQSQAAQQLQNEENAKQIAHFAERIKSIVTTATAREKESQEAAQRDKEEIARLHGELALLGAAGKGTYLQCSYIDPCIWPFKSAMEGKLFWVSLDNRLSLCYVGLDFGYDSDFSCKPVVHVCEIGEPKTRRTISLYNSTSSLNTWREDVHSMTSSDEFGLSSIKIRTTDDRAHRKGEDICFHLLVHNSQAQNNDYVYDFENALYKAKQVKKFNTSQRDALDGFRAHYWNELRNLTPKRTEPDTEGQRIKGLLRRLLLLVFLV